MSVEEQHFISSLSPEKYLRANTALFSAPHGLTNLSGDDGSDQREIGDEALSWELSSAKSGHGVQQLRDDNLTTFWQSDGLVPHKVTILFHKKQIISSIAIYTDYKLDESYTPQDIVIKASSSSLHNYENHIVCKRSLNEPVGWIVLPLHAHKRQNVHDKYLKTNKIIFEIQSSHQSGRDTHIRQIKIYAPNLLNLNLSKNNKSMFDHYRLKTKQSRNNILADSDTDDDDEEEEEEEQMSSIANRKKKQHQLVFESKPTSSLQLLQHESLR
eukprot:CAMPEP_0197057634 /NCGR_PEP_ID=MMETSP1384-20130603/99210_1 /TAXON_ID=29189 /ORGANISM="Ammonia sp." /LENGTH=270 /DNA_ID=CAMNT_0042492133 /DNA_START=16 /DNA_END=828 /DNA_ORIENTATION=-